MNLRTRFVFITASLVFVLATAMSIGAYQIATAQLSQQVNESLNNRITLNPAEFGDPTRQIWANGQRFNVVVADYMLLLPARAINLAAAQSTRHHNGHSFFN